MVATNSRKKKERPVVVVTTNAATLPPKPEAEVTRITINSLGDLERLHRQQTTKAEENRFGLMQRAVQMASGIVGNNFGPYTDAYRLQIMKFLLDGRRDIDGECGYPDWLTPDHYRAMYDREGIARRVVHCEPEESWAIEPDIFEDKDPTTETEFETQFELLDQTHNIRHYLQRIDVLSGIGQFGVLLFGLNDEKELQDAVEGINDDGTISGTNEYDLLYIRPFSEEVTFVKTRETDTTSPRYGKPTMYTIHFRDYPNWGIQAGEIVARDVHWTRILHVADDRKMSEIYGTPRMQTVWNRLADLRKIYSSSGEGYWKGSFPGISFEVLPEVAAQGLPLDVDSLKKEVKDYQDNLQRNLMLTGVSAKTLPVQTVDPTGFLESQLKAIAISKGIPYRVLFGSEEAKLAADQDSRAWNKRLKKRQEKYLTPMLIRPFVDRMIAYGVLPKPKEYFVEWDDLNTPTDKDKSEVALTLTQAIAQYVQSGSSQFIPPQVFLTEIMGLTHEQAEMIIEASEEYQSQIDGEGGQDEMDEGEGQMDDVPGDEQQGEDEESEGDMGGGASPDNGSTIEQDNLSGRSTLDPKDKKSKKAKQVPPQFTTMPSLNTRMVNRVRRRNASGRIDRNGKGAGAKVRKGKGRA